MNRKIDNMNTKLELLIEFVDKMKDGPNDGKLCKEYRDNAAQLKKNPEPVMDNQELEGTDLEWTNNDPMIEDKINKENDIVDEKYSKGRREVLNELWTSDKILKDGYWFVKLTDVIKIIDNYRN